jgi:hypothetical protein
MELIVDPLKFFLKLFITFYAILKDFMDQIKVNKIFIDHKINPCNKKN